MGISSSNSLKSFKKFSREKDFKLFVAGLDNAGKTTMLYKLQLFETHIVELERGFCYHENIRIQNIYFINLDVGGCERFKTIFNSCYQENIKGIIYIIDSDDRDRIDCAKNELQRILKEERLNNIPILILANKQDLPGVMRIEEINQQLELYLIRGRNWYLQGCSIINSYGLTEGLEWLSKAIQSE